MRKMNAVRWIFPLVLCFTCVSSNDDQCNQEFNEDRLFCDTERLFAPLGSSVLLPCTVPSGSLHWVSWTHNLNVTFVNLSSEGRVKFADPRSGRVKAFPNQSARENYSIRIDEVEDSDFGCYRCKTQGNYCLQLKLLKPDAVSKEMWLLISICAGVAALVCVFTCLIFNKIKQNNRSNPAHTGMAGIEVVSAASAPPLEVERPPVQEQQRGVDNSVYENDDQDPNNLHGTRKHSGLEEAQPYYLHTTEPTPSTSGLYPNLNQFNFERVRSQRTRQRFHIELISRLRQASFTQHYYVNQRELGNQQATSNQRTKPHRDVGKKKAKENSEYKNPIYNSGTDHLNHL